MPCRPVPSLAVHCRAAPPRAVPRRAAPHRLASPSSMATVCSVVGFDQFIAFGDADAHSGMPERIVQHRRRTGKRRRCANSICFKSRSVRGLAVCAVQLPHAQDAARRAVPFVRAHAVKEKVRAEMTPRPKTVPEAASRAAPAASAEVSKQARRGHTRSSATTESDSGSSFARAMWHRTRMTTPVGSTRSSRSRRTGGLSRRARRRIGWAHTCLLGYD